MAMSSGLTPELRVNKLGHVLTKHFRNAGADSASTKLPMVLSTSGDRSARVSLLTERFYAKYASHMNYSPQQNKLFRGRINAALSEFTELSLSRLEGATSVDGPLAGLLRTTMSLPSTISLSSWT
jgi:hypothetical protein